ncbi:MAG: FAD-dependent tricarballylate dehydrogenase TcuA [Thermodesulfobacteriota bacterium]|nr:FAD-dependent tricarballylate dehydrogenase TcuA [Thermodesulfobacteriota bacterium]
MDVKKNLNCDVLVVGGGNTGVVAAIEAKNAGAQVLIIEKAPKKARGGNSRLSGGLFRIAAEGNKDYLPLLEGTTLPKGELDIEPYPKDDYYNKVIRLSQGRSEQRLTEIFVNRSLDTVKWMKEQGVKWDLNPAHMSRIGDRLFWPAGQTVLIANGAGEGLVEMLYGIAENKRIEILYETGGRSLIMNAEGKVCGVEAKGLEGFIRINAKNVILSCGGFQANPAWRRRYLGEGWDLVKLRGTRYDTGDGIQMALQADAQLVGHWGGCHASIVSEDSPMIEAASAGSERYSYQYCIMVNQDGKRFLDEGEDFMVYTYAKFGKEILKQPGAVAFQIYDAKVIPILRSEYQNALKVESHSLKELAEEMDINVENFLQTVKAFNEAIVNDDQPFLTYKLDGRRTKGLTPDKTNWAQKIDTPPYQGYAVVCGLTMTYGGIRTNEKAQVIDTSEQPVKGLYAVGEVTGGFFYHNYPSGTGLVRGAVMGRIAGAEAVANIGK